MLYNQDRVMGMLINNAAGIRDYSSSEDSLGILQEGKICGISKKFAKDA